MRIKTKNFIEDTFIIIAFLIIVYLIYFFVFKEESNNLAENSIDQDRTTIIIDDKGKEEKNINEQQKEDNFFISLYEELKEKLLSNEKTIASLTNDVKPSQPTITMHNTREEVATREYDSNTNINNNLLDSTTIDNLRENNSIPQIETNETQNHEGLNDKDSLYNSSTSSTIHDNELQEEELIQQNDFTIQELKTNENSTHINIHRFFEEFEKKVQDNINKNIDKSSFKTGQYVNLRITILKNGKFEQISFMGGNSDYFNLIKKSVEDVFPLEIMEELKTHFPRYYRMKIDF